MSAADSFQAGHLAFTAPDPTIQEVAETTLGRCANLDYCSIGQHREEVRVKLGEPFVCPECHMPLRPPGLQGFHRPVVLPLLRLLVLSVGVGLGAAIGYTAGTSHTAARLAALPAVPAPRPAPVAPAPPPPAPPAHSKPPAQQASPTEFERALARLGGRSAAAPAEALAPLTTVVQDNPYPRHPPPLDRADPPPVLQSEKHYGEVAVDCVFASGATRPVCRASAVRGADAFSAAATAWLQNLAPQYAAGPDHRWRVVFDDFAGAARGK